VSSEGLLLRLFEYQAKRIFSENGIKIPRGVVAHSSNEVFEIAHEFGAPVVIKSQVLVGGRGLSGGIKSAQDKNEAKKLGEQLLNSSLKGEEIFSVLVEEKVSIEKEFFAGILIDYNSKSPVIIASSKGGVDIESIALENPVDIIIEKIDDKFGLTDFKARSIAKAVGLRGRLMFSFSSLLQSLFIIHKKYDATLVEVNPLALTNDGSFLAVDAKITLDDNASFRHNELYKTLKSVRPKPTEGSKLRKFLSENVEIPTYIELDGNIGIIADGAGTGMLTLDLTKDYGGKIESYCELGGRATPKLIEEAMTIVLSNQDVEVLLINLIGGLNRMDEMAQGIASYLENNGKDGKVKQDIIVRMSGTLEAEGRNILKASGISSFDNIYDAIEKTVEFSRRC
jgi:succinyl-CoA synthetase beta subunit